MYKHKGVLISLSIQWMQHCHQQYGIPAPAPACQQIGVGAVLSFHATVAPLAHSYLAQWGRLANEPAVHDASLPTIGIVCGKTKYTYICMIFTSVSKV